MADIETNTKVGLISKALVLCGEAPTNSLSEDRYGVTVGSNLFELIYENELQSNRWRFSCAKKALSRLNSAPLNEWQYVYQLPADMLLLLGTYPRSRYEIYGSHLYTNETTVEVEYQFKPEITAVPAYFAQLMVYALARDMIKPITESEAATEALRVKYTQQRARALYADAQARPNRPIYDSPFVDVR